MFFSGNVFKYCSNGLVAFYGGDRDSDVVLILVGGLSDGLLSLPYTQSILDLCTDVNIGMIQPILSSSYKSYGFGSLLSDAAELKDLMEYMVKFMDVQKFYLMGHSTGCQDILTLLREYSYLSSLVKGVVLQGAVSDREYWTHQHGALREELLQWSREHVNSNSDILYPQLIDGVPFTAKRIISLMSADCDEDMFSSDLSYEVRLRRMGSTLNIPILHLFSGKDEYVPPTKHRQTFEILSETFDRLVATTAKPFSDNYFIEDADHAISDAECRDEMISALKTFIETLL